MIVLSNAGPLIALSKLNRLTLLSELYGTVLVPRAVEGEVVTAQGRPDALTARLFLQHYRWPILEASPEVLNEYHPPVILDGGERELLALARTLQDPLLLLDDEVARSEARRLGFRLRGTLGVLVQAHRSGLLPFTEVELLILEIAARPDIWIGEKLCHAVLDELRPRD